jgi:hypothetical protein
VKFHLPYQFNVLIKLTKLQTNTLEGASSLPNTSMRKGWKEHLLYQHIEEKRVFVLYKHATKKGKGHLISTIMPPKVHIISLLKNWILCVNPLCRYHNLFICPLLLFHLFLAIFSTLFYYSVLSQHIFRFYNHYHASFLQLHEPHIISRRTTFPFA